MANRHCRPAVGWAAGLAVALTLGLGSGAQQRERGEIQDTYKWNLSDIYANDAAWRAAKEKLQADIPRLAQFRGRLTDSSAVLADTLDLMFGLDKEMARLDAYASMLADQDTRDADHQGMRQQMQQVSAAFNGARAYVEPEILRLEPAVVRRFLASDRRLTPYRFYIEDILRRAAHTLSDAEEKILAAVGPLGASPADSFNVLSNADFPYPTVTLSDGRKVKLDQAAYSTLRALPVRSDRQLVMSSFFESLGRFSRTFGSTTNGNLQRTLLVARTRKYTSTLEASLDGPNIPVSVYERLIDGVNRNLPAFHRYLNLRKRMLGVSELHYYDLYAPLVASVQLTYTPEEAQKNVLAALAPLGPDYTSTIERAFGSRWIDWFPTEGKRSGAYSEGGAYDVHPYVLLNYGGRYSDMSTVAHELGHTMHSYYSNRTQPYPLAGHPTFVAEVASTFNEALLIEHLLERIQDSPTRLSLLGNYLENIKATVFRQTQFAEFELRTHQMVEQGLPITGEALDRLYLDITRRYYGHAQGVCLVDDYVAHEWSYVPHFYRDFYVYQYATSFTASTALAEKVLAGGAAGAEATKRYLAFLGMGGSRYPIDLLKDAGVDMTTDEPLALTMREMNRVMDEMEKAIAAGRVGEGGVSAR
jgi:oligoendopeptidase F